MGGGSNLFEPDEFATFTQEDIDERIKGSKIVVVSEQAMLNVIYTLKACMLFMYSRLTMNTTQHRFLKILAGYICCGYIGSELAFFLACRPFYGYWAVPPPNPQCTTLQHYAIAQACFNISSDFFLLLIPLPMIIKLNLPLKQRIVLGCVFSMVRIFLLIVSLVPFTNIPFQGIFVILAAILTKVFNLGDVYSPTYMLWYTREASVAVYVSNLPLIWPLLREWFPFLRSISVGSKPTPSYGKNYPKGHPSHVVTIGGTGARSGVARSKNELSVFETELDSYGHGMGKSSQAASSSDGSTHSATVSGGMHHDGIENKKPTKFDFGITSHKRSGSPASDERVLHQSQGGNNLWGEGQVHKEVTIEIERESMDLEAGHGNGGGWGRQSKVTGGPGRVGREVRIEGP